jgi:hypothetical protein
MEQTIIPSSNTTYILSGELKKQQSKNNKDAILYMDITSRVICIQNKNVSSVASDPKSFIQKLKDDNGNTAFHAVISSQESDNKQLCLAHLSKIKVVRKNGKNILKITASANKFHASGNFAQNSINLNNIPEGETTITLLSENASVARFLNQVIRLAQLQIYPQTINWVNLPGSRPILFGSRVNWGYLAIYRANDYPALQVNMPDNRLQFFFRGIDSRGNITEMAALTREELPNNMSLFGIDNYEIWRKQYGHLFGL